MATATPSKTPRTVQTPGAAPAQATEPAAAMTTEQVASLDLSDLPAASDAGAGEPNAAEEVNDEVAALRAQLAAANAQNLELQANLAAKAAQTAQAKAAPVVVDPSRPHLTPEGWLVPTTFGQPVRKA